MIWISHETSNSTSSLPSGENVQDKTHLANGVASDDAFAKGYMKNLIIRYMIYQARGNDSESRIVRRAIFDFLMATDPERTQVENAINQASSGISKLSFFKF